MKKMKILAVLLGGLAMAGATIVWAADEVTITGNMMCGKCTLHLTKECQNVVQVVENGTTNNYYLKQNEISKDKHSAICPAGSSEKVTVTGTVEEKDGKKIMTPTKIEVVS